MTIPSTPYLAMEEIDDLRERVEYLVRAYLRRAGWTFTCETPGSTWAWKKDIDGQCYVAHTQTAEEIQRAIDTWAMNRTHKPVRKSDGACIACGSTSEDDPRHQA